MSIRTLGAVLDHSPQKAARKLLMVCIASSENANSQQCNPSIETLAWYMNVSPRYVKKLLPDLVKSGELVIVSTVLRTNQYFVPIYPHEPGYYDPGECIQTHTCNGHHGPILNRDDLARENNPRWKNRQRRQGTRVINNVDNLVSYPHAVGNHSSPRGEPEYPTEGNQSTPRRGTPVPPNLKSESVMPESEGESGASRQRKKVSRRDLEHADFLRETAELKARRKGDAR